MNVSFVERTSKGKQISNENSFYIFEFPFESFRESLNHPKHLSRKQTNYIFMN